MYGWDSRGHRLHHQYDAVRRPTQLFLSNGLVERLAEHFIYGEDQPNDTQLNLRGKAYQQLDGAGIVTNEIYDFKGNLLSARRQFLQNYKDDVDWTQSPALEDESFASSTTYDVLNRPVTMTTPDQSVIRPTYNEASFLNAVEANLQGKQKDGEPIWTNFVKNIDYNEKGQREIIEYGNDAKTSYAYDPKTFQLTHLLTIRITDRVRLQDLSYAYDPVGNITQISDNAQQSTYFNNQVVSSTANYVYDAIYRLIAADAREHIGQVTTPQPTWNDKFRVNLPHPNEGQAMRRYAEAYEYDAVGNIEQVIHYLGSLSNSTNPSGSVAWKRSYVYDEANEMPQNNRLTSTSIGTVAAGTIHEQYTYDEHGNLTAMPHLADLNWNFKDHLRLVDLGGGGIAYYVYDASGQRIRKVIERQNGTRQKERFYLGGLEVYREYDGRGNNTIKLERETLHVTDNQQRIALIETRTQGGNGSPNQLIRFQLSNHLGSAVLDLDNGCAVISYEEYYPYGSTSYQAGRSMVEVSLKHYRYTGMERDEETGLEYHSARYYMPWLGRWSSADPIGIRDTVNLYQYVSGNPLKLVDPSGESGWDRFLGVVKAVGGAFEVAAGVGLVGVGVATSELGVGIPIGAGGAAVTLHGADTVVSGVRTAFAGEEVDSFTSQALQTAAGLTRTQANLADAGIGIVGTLGASALTKAPAVAVAVAETAPTAARALPAVAEAAPTAARALPAVAEAAPTAARALPAVAEAVPTTARAVRATAATAPRAAATAPRAAAAAPRAAAARSAAPQAFGTGARLLRARAIVDEAGKASGIQVSRYVDEIRYAANSISFFEVTASGRRILTLGSQAFRRTRAGQILEAAHELVHAQQYALALQRAGGNVAKAVSAFNSAKFGSAAYATDEVIAESLALRRVASYLQLSPQQVAASTRYINSWRSTPLPLP